MYAIQTFNRPNVIQNLRVSSVLCFLTLRLVLLLSCPWCRATVHKQNKFVGQGHFHTLGQWLWSNQKEMPLPNITNYLFWHNRQDSCFSLNSIFISSSLLSDQCWWRYIKCLEFQWNWNYKGLQGVCKCSLGTEQHWGMQQSVPHSLLSFLWFPSGDQSRLCACHLILATTQGIWYLWLSPSGWLQIL